MPIADRLILLATGLVALYAGVRLLNQYLKDKTPSHLYSAAAFFVLLAAGLLLIVFQWQILANTPVVLVSVLIPLGLALGLVSEFYPRAEKGFLGFAAVGLAVIAVTRLAGFPGLATPVLALVHGVCGVLIVLVPLLAIKTKRAPAAFAWVSVGGALIDLGGIAMTFLRMGSQLLFFSEAVVFAIFAPLLFLMTLSFAWGLVHTLADRQRPAAPLIPPA